MSFDFVHRDDCETSGPWRLVRRTLGLSSFGMNLVDIPPGEQIPEHDETQRDHEEVFFVVSGTPTLVVDGEDLPTRAGAFARLDPEHRRTVRNDGEETARSSSRPPPLERLRADGVGVTSSTQQLEELIAAYNEAWNAHDVERIGSMHAPDMVFENHTAGASRRREGTRAHCPHLRVVA